MKDKRLPRILVLGLIGAGRAQLSPAQLARVLEADLLVGGDRQLAWFPDASGERLRMGQGIALAAERLRQARDAGRRAVVLASGDPLCYGVGASLRRWFAAEELEIVPAPSAYQLAFAALGEPWHDAALLSAHGRPLDQVLPLVCAAPRAAILTDDQHTPAAIARALCGAGLPADTPCAVCENLSEPAQRIVRATLAEIVDQTFAPLNVFVVWNEQASALSAIGYRLLAIAPGIPDREISTTGGLLTRREIRLLSLAELALQPGEVCWDLGAGSGAVGIEAARWQPAASVYAVEQRDLMCDHIRENLRRFPAPNLWLVEGIAPDACADLPDPDAVFIGGSGGQLAELIVMLRGRLRPGGRLALALVTLENLQTARACLPDARLVQVQVSVGTPILDMLRLEAHNPVFLLTWRKTEHL